ncbi:AAA family ATPase [Streptomyces sp. NPDC056600]|uniref:AAA family ATPase n=1 Tax=Streptomyces sp. NPDC056600 TaxID=3345874 RepID=UPI0036D0D54B
MSDRPHDDVIEDDGDGSTGGWWFFRATGVPPEGSGPDAPPAIPPAPYWRQFSGAPVQDPPPEPSSPDTRRLGLADSRVHLRDEEIEVVNAALLLRRPLLVTGPPGVGKSTLAYLIARELRLGRVLSWNIVSRTTLRDGLYEYDAIGRAQAIAAWRAGADPVDPGAAQQGDERPERPPYLGDFITLGPLGTALLAYNRPRVLLIDELDKSDIDLPNDLLHVMEDGSYPIPELVRTKQPSVEVLTDDPGGQAVVHGGRVECREFPVVIITSNGEREFPAAFRRRCLPLDLQAPTREQLMSIVASHLRHRPEGLDTLLDDFVTRLQGGGTHSVDQLLNAAYLTSTGVFQAQDGGHRLLEMLLRDLAKGR